MIFCVLTGGGWLASLFERRVWRTATRVGAAIIMRSTTAIEPNPSLADSFAVGRTPAKVEPAPRTLNLCDSSQPSRSSLRGDARTQRGIASQPGKPFAGGSEAARHRHGSFCDPMVRRLVRPVNIGLVALIVLARSWCKAVRQRGRLHHDAGGQSRATSSAVELCWHLPTALSRYID